MIVRIDKLLDSLNKLKYYPGFKFVIKLQSLTRLSIIYPVLLTSVLFSSYNLISTEAQQNYFPFNSTNSSNSTIITFTPEENCYDGIDNDNDGKIDSADDDCIMVSTNTTGPITNHSSLPLRLVPDYCERHPDDPECLPYAGQNFSKIIKPDYYNSSTLVDNQTSAIPQSLKSLQTSNTSTTLPVPQPPVP